MLRIVFILVILSASAAAQTPTDHEPHLEKYNDIQIDKFKKMCDPNLVVPGIRIPKLRPSSRMCQAVSARIAAKPLQLPAPIRAAPSPGATP